MDKLKSTKKKIQEVLKTINDRLDDKYIYIEILNTSLKKKMKIV